MSIHHQLRLADADKACRWRADLRCCNVDNCCERLDLNYEADHLANECCKEEPNVDPF